MAQTERRRIADYAMRFPDLAPILNEWLSHHAALKPGSVAREVLENLNGTFIALKTHPDGKIHHWDMDRVADEIMRVLDMSESTSENLPPLVRQGGQFAVRGLPEAAGASLALAQHNPLKSYKFEHAILGTAYLVSALNRGYGTEAQEPIAQDHFIAGVVYLARAVDARMLPTAR